MNKIPVIDSTLSPYAKEGKIHVRLTRGKFQNWRRLISWPLMALFFGMVWVTVEGQPWVHFSFAERNILLFGSLLSWNDLPLLAGLMIAGSSLLFFMAVAWGRVWCGFACPQSIWTWMFIRIEDWTEGRAAFRQKSEQRPLTGMRMIRRIIKHMLWLILALMTAFTFTGYFIPIRALLTDALTLQLSTLVYGWLFIMTGLTYVNAGLVREKICLHACPYARFQSVMFDQHTRTVSYDHNRGEPRGALGFNTSSRGDCVDCSLCVQVCPTGIDIRDGLQAACIDCAACIDACDAVMQKIGREPGLIRFASESQLAKQPSAIVRPYLLGYGLVCLLALGVVLIGFQHKTTLLVEISRDRGSLFTQQENGEICNHYRVKLERFDPAFEQLRVSVSGAFDFRLFGPHEISLDQQSTQTNYRICVANIDVDRTDVIFTFTGADKVLNMSTSFISQRI